MAVFKKLFIGDIVATSNGKCFRRIRAEEGLVAGLYDENDNLVESWDTLVNTYGMDIEKDYGSGDFQTDRANPSYIFTNTLTTGTKLVIAYGITYIGSHSFTKCSNLSSIIIPESVTTIGSFAFFNCKILTSINIPASLTSIGDSAFSSSQIGTVHLTDIEAWCNLDLSNVYGSSPLYHATVVYLNGKLLTDLTIPYGVVSIPALAFNGCPTLERVTIPDSVTTIGPSAFETTSVMQAIIGNGVTYIPAFMFRGCGNFGRVTIPVNVTRIGQYAFSCSF